jgi:ubiquinone/menaquinone biosynthesis C-methylase UbiE
LATAEFDQIAGVYDETRRPLNEATVSGMKEMLTKYHCRSILEIAVGTGRVSVPLLAAGFEIAGLDISRKMMQRAREKGINNLVLASGTDVPFKDESFDATLTAHVFHIIRDPVPVLRECARVSHVGVFALVRKGGVPRRWLELFGGSAEGSENGREIPSDPALIEFYERRILWFRALAEKYNWKPNSVRNWQMEQEILKQYPPDNTSVVSDLIVQDSLEDRIARIEKSAYGSMSGMPEEMKREIVQKLKTETPRGIQPRHEVYELVMWRPQTLLQLASSNYLGA